MTLAEGLLRLNAMSRLEAEAALLRCCGSVAWARRMAEARPFADSAAVYAEADRAWWELGRDAWLEAFRAHPRIGERDAATPRGAAERAWSAREQAGVARASRDLRSALADGNRAYEARFGHIFIVCATGKSAEEMLALLTARLANDPDTELRVAAEEQRKITRLRLERLLAGAG
jgi:OHCU decarboxylase